MKVTMQDFISFQVYILKKQAYCGAEHLKAILCKHELQVGTKCVPRYNHEECLTCCGEYLEKKQKEADRD